MNDERRQLLLDVADMIEAEPEKYFQNLFMPGEDCGCLAYFVIKAKHGLVRGAFAHGIRQAEAILGINREDANRLFVGWPLRDSVAEYHVTAEQAVKTLRRMAADGLLSWHDADGYDVEGLDLAGRDRRGRKRFLKQYEHQE